LDILATNNLDRLRAFLCVFLGPIFIALFSGNSVIADKKVAPEHKTVGVLRENSIYDTQHLQPCAFSFSFPWCFVMWNAEVLEHLFQWFPRLVIDPSLPAATSLPRSSRAVKNKEQLDIEREKATYSKEHCFLYAPIRLAGCCNP
jgi:hypothetical protein